MKKLILTEKHFKDKVVRELVHEYITPLKVGWAPVWLFDVYGTIVFEDGKIDTKIVKLIDFLIKKGYQVILLSYDASDKRIDEHEKLLNEHSETLKNLPKIFMKKRKKGTVIKYMYQNLSASVKDKKTYMIISIDDRESNIDDIGKFSQEDVMSFQYLKHTKQNVDNLSDLLEKPSVFYSF
jgi:hypothetical protein